tara:strand:- start:38 stop:265 length:228 start_codon:yes stop_codon:yes gene_type:complete
MVVETTLGVLFLAHVYFARRSRKKLESEVFELREEIVGSMNKTTAMVNKHTQDLVAFERELRHFKNLIKEIYAKV